MYRLPRLGAFFVTLIASCSAGVIVDNYPVNGTIDAFTINFGFEVSDSFTLNAPATVRGVNFGVWLFPGDQITSVDWAIGTGPFGTDFGSGTSAVSMLSDLIAPNTFGYDVQSVNFSIPDTPLLAGTYYLSLQNAVTTQTQPAFWDQNNGLGIDAWQNNGTGQLSGTDCAGAGGGGNGTCAQSFQILDTAGTPEPSAFALTAAGLLLAGAFARRIQRQ
jgi:hypothetical protein